MTLSFIPKYSLGSELWSVQSEKYSCLQKFVELRGLELPGEIAKSSFYFIFFRKNIFSLVKIISN